MTFEQAYEDNAERVYGFFAYRLGSRMDAEDLTQLTFERALAAWDRYDPSRAAVPTWLLAIARNALIDHLRRDRVHGPALDSDDELAERKMPTVPGPEETELGLSPDLASALARLRNRDREVLALRFGADLRTAEIAELLELSVANVQQILSRTLRRLRVELDARSGIRN